MPFQTILADLMNDVDQAVGVLFLDDAGETIDLATDGRSPHEMQLLGAYVGIYLRQLKRFLEPEAFGDLKVLHIESRTLHVFALPLADGYYIVLAQHAPALSGRTRRQLVRAGDLLIRELFAH